LLQTDMTKLIVAFLDFAKASKILTYFHFYEHDVWHRTPRFRRDAGLVTPAAIRTSEHKNFNMAECSHVTAVHKQLLFGRKEYKR